jgi:CBS domain-containing protein
MLTDGRSLLLMLTSYLLLLTPVVSFNPTGQRMPRLGMSNLPNRSVKKLFVASPMTTTIPPPLMIPRPILSGSDIVKGMMRTEFPRVFETETVSATMEAMRIADKGSVLIFNSEDKLSGIFTERDFVKKIIGSELEEKTTVISTVMTPRSALIVTNSESSIDDCRELMIDNNIRHLPILNFVGEAVGIISMRDIIRVSHNEDMCSIATFYGSSLGEVEEEAKDLANRLSLGRDLY